MGLRTRPIVWDCARARSRSNNNKDRKSLAALGDLRTGERLFLVCSEEVAGGLRSEAGTKLVEAGQRGRTRIIEVSASR
jgi:hypothetical protein